MRIERFRSSFPILFLPVDILRIDRGPQSLTEKEPSIENNLPLATDRQNRAPREGRR